MSDRRSFESGYLRRIVDDELDHALTHPAPVLLDGPPGVGTTSIASNRARTIKHLDHRNVRRILTADPDRTTAGPTPILFDQWHHHPPLWHTLTDNPNRSGPFLLTGISPDPRHEHDPTVVTSVRVRPLTLPERLDITPTVSLADLIANRPIPPTRSDLDLGDYIDEIAAGGFPHYRHLNQPAVRRRLDSYLRHLIDQHLPEAGHTVRQPDALRNWLRAYATATSTTNTWEQIRLAANPQRPPAATTTRRYTADLTRLRILDPLPGWAPANSPIRDLLTGPKHHLADPALTLALLDLDTEQLHDSHDPTSQTLLDRLFESLVALTLQVFAQHNHATVHHLRTKGGRHHIDFIIEHPNGIVAINTHLGPNIAERDLRQLHWLHTQLPHHDTTLAVITTGPDAHTRPDGTRVIPLAALGP